MTAIDSKRITSIDFLRGAIMIIMALDHVRDYLYKGSFYFDPLDLEQTNGPLYFTRWITHLCAPLFMLLAGTSAYISSQRKSKKELSVFLLKRGLWLIFLEMFIVNFGWNFNIAFPMFMFITIWALGVSMMVLAALIHLPMKLILGFSLVLIAGHNLLDPVTVEGNNLRAFGWSLIHDQQGFQWGNKLLLVGYPLVPLIAIMPLGYCMGSLYTTKFDSNKRRRILATAGWISIGLFIVSTLR